MERTYIPGLVSVIMPIYNAEKYLADTLNSIADQTYRPIEVVMVDDCSKDSSYKIAVNMAKQLSCDSFTVKLYIQDKNGGVSKTRNEAIGYATGQYVAFCDSDDLWDSQKLEKQVIAMTSKGFGFSCTGSSIIDENGISKNRKRRVPKIITYKTLLKNTCIATSSVLIDRNYFSTICFPDRRTGEDYACWLGILRHSKGALGIDEPLLLYREVNNSLSSSKKGVFGEIWYAQHTQEKIFSLNVVINFLFYCWNAFKKRYL